MANFNLFTPLSPTKKISASSSSSRVALDLPNVGRAIRVYNDLSEVVFIEFGDSTVTATTGSLPIGPKATEPFECPQRASHVAAITASGSGNIYFTEGQGA